MKEDRSETTPILCSLNDVEFREREAKIIRHLMSRVLSMSEIHDGYVYTFASDQDMIEKLQEFVELEQQCCGFLDFDIKNSKAGESLLIITGPDRTKEFISATFKK